VRVEGVVLENHRDVAVLGRHVGHHAVADQDVAAGDFLQPREAAQRRRLPAAGGTYQHQELAIGDVQVQVVDGRDPVEAFGDMVEDHLRHAGFPLFPVSTGARAWCHPHSQSLPILTRIVPTVTCLTECAGRSDARPPFQDWFPARDGGCAAHRTPRAAAPVTRRKPSSRDLKGLGDPFVLQCIVGSGGSTDRKRG